MPWYDDLASWMRDNPGTTGALVGGIGALLDPAQAQTTTQNTTTRLPDYIAPYVGRLLSGIEAQSQEGYTPYTGQRVAQLSGDQQSAINNFRTQAGAGGANPTMQAGASALQSAANGLGQIGYDPQTYANQYRGQPGYVARNYTPAQVNSQGFDNAAASRYMSPYMQQVVDAQKREAVRDYSQQAQGNNASAVRAGAFGGSRHGVVEAEAQRNLQTRLGDIQSTGLQNAFQNAQSQFNADQGRSVAAQQSNQTAGLQGAGLNNQNTQFGAQLGMQNATNQATFGQAANQLNSQNQQASTQLGIGALGQQAQAGQALTNAGQQMWGNQTGANQNLFGAGTAQQQLSQQGMDVGYQDFLRQQQYPYDQLRFMQSGLQGLPMTQYATASTTPAPTLTQQMLSSGIGGYMLGQNYGR